MSSQPDPNSGLPMGNSSFTVNSKILIVAAASLFALLVFMFGMHLYVKFLWGPSQLNEIDEADEAEAILERRRRRRSERRRRRRLEEQEEVSSGLEKSAVDLLPTFVFKAEEAVKADMECAVCLEDFEDGERGRLLPKCNHCFHLTCIDTWFNSHSSCPLCRCEVAPVSPHIDLPRCPRDDAFRFEASDSSFTDFSGEGDHVRGYPGGSPLPRDIQIRVACAAMSVNASTVGDESVANQRQSSESLAIDMSRASTAMVENNAVKEQPPGLLVLRRPSPSPGTSTQLSGSSGVDVRPPVSSYSTSSLPLDEDTGHPARGGHRRRRSYLTVEIVSDFQVSA